MNMTDESKNGFAFDTCVSIYIHENPNVGGLLRCRLELDGATVHLDEQVRYELRKKGHDIEDVAQAIQKTTGAQVVISEITGEMDGDARRMEGLCSNLHAGDSSILAHAMATGLRLVTCDKGLIKAAGQFGAKIVDPNILPCDEIGKKTRSRYRGIVRAEAKMSAARQTAPPARLQGIAAPSI